MKKRITILSLSGIIITGVIITISACSYRSYGKILKFMTEFKEKINNSNISSPEIDYLITDATIYKDTIFFDIKDGLDSIPLNRYEKHPLESKEKLVDYFSNVSQNIPEFKELFSLAAASDIQIVSTFVNDITPIGARIILSPNDILKIKKGENKNWDRTAMNYMILKKNILAPINEGYGRTLKHITLDNKNKLVIYNYELNESITSITEMNARKDLIKEQFIYKTSELPWSRYYMMKFCAKFGYTQISKFTGDKSKETTEVTFTPNDLHKVLQQFGEDTGF